jgi:RimJ/RimL family protein N-acetyltransferase
MRYAEPRVIHPPIELQTERLLLRQWRLSDRQPFAELNADPRVMEFFPSTLEPEASNASVVRWQSEIEQRGWGLWAAEIRRTGELIGFVGLQIPPAQLPFSPCVEVGWRLAHAYWGKGFATEAARAALEVGFQRLQLEEIVSFTAVNNRRSRAVMERLGMREAEATFEHPGVPDGSPLREHCLYRITRFEWSDRDA